MPKTTVFFLPQKAEFCKIKKKQLCASLTFDRKKVCAKFHQNLFTSLAAVTAAKIRTAPTTTDNISE